MDDWIDFYDSAHTLYVDARHRDVHFRRVADDIARHVPSPSAVVLDYGCGEALHADRVAAPAARLILVEPAPGVRARLSARFRDNPKIEVRSPGDLSAFPAGSIDLIVMHSVAQYLTRQELDATLGLFRRLVRADGLLLLGDVIPPQVTALTDALALLRFGAAEGFLWAAVRGLVRTVFSPYRRLRRSVGLSRYDEGAITARLAAAGFAAKRAPCNIGHNQARLTFLATPTPAPGDQASNSRMRV
jgi:SAM-dependent methyltransferase